MNQPINNWCASFKNLYLNTKEFMLKNRTLFEVAALILIVIGIYQFCYMDYARRDQLAFMKERVRYTDGARWFYNAINTNRTRTSPIGDYYLFRPGFYFCLAAEDALLHDSMIIVGTISILLHLSVVVLLYFLFKKCFAPAGSFLFSAFFAVQYAGVEMIAWRHISFYMISIALVIAASLIYSDQSDKRRILAASVLFVSMLFHELIPVSIVLLMVCLGLALLVGHIRNSSADKKLANMMCGLGGIIFFYFILNGISWIATRPPSVLIDADHMPYGLGGVVLVSKNFLYYLGAGTRATLAPWSIELIPVKGCGFNWDIRNGQMYIYLIWSMGAIAIIGAVWRVSISRIIEKRDEASDLIALWACCALVSFAAIQSFARGSLRDLNYFTIATYNYWFFAVLYMILLKYLTEVLIKRFMLDFPKRKVILIVIGFLLTGVVAYQGFRTGVALKTGYDLAWAKQLREAIKKGKLHFDSNPQACIDYSAEIQSHEGVIAAYLNKYSCGFAKGLLVEHPVIKEDGTVQFTPSSALLSKDLSG